MNRDFDGKGFDQDGVGEARVVSGSALTGEIEHPPADEEIPNQPAPAPTYNDEPLPVDIDVDIAEQPVSAESEKAMHGADLTSASVANTQVQTDVTEELALESEPSVYQTPVTQAKPKVSTTAPSKATSSASLKKNQIELNFDDSIDTSASGERKEPTIGGEVEVGDVENDLASKEQTPQVEQPEIETEVIVLSVVMPQGQLMSGAALPAKLVNAWHEVW